MRGGGECILSAIFSLSLSSLFIPLHHVIVVWLVVHLSPHLSRNNLAEKFFADGTIEHSL